MSQQREGSRRDIEPGEARIQADPQNAPHIRIQGIDFEGCIRRYPRGPQACAERIDAAGLRVETIESGGSTDPYLSKRIFRDGKNRIVAERAGIGGIVPVFGRLVLLDIEAAHAAAARRDPEAAAAIDVNGADPGAGFEERLTVACRGQTELAKARVAPHQPASVAADPKPSGGIAGEGGDPVAG